MSRLSIAPALAALFLLCACGSRNGYWDYPVANATSYGLKNGVALVDDADHRVMMVTALDDQQVQTRTFAIGHNAASTTTSPDGTHLFVLSTGDWPRRTSKDEFPSLTVIDASTFDFHPARYEMTEPLANLAVDPLGRWAVAYAGAAATTSFVQNANEIVVFDLSTPGATPVSRTIRSYGGTPQELIFTPKLQLPTGQRRLLIIETNIDITFVDLDDMSQPEVTIPLTSGTSAQQVTPAGVVVDGFDPTNPLDARIALRANDNTNVFTWLLGPSSDPSQEYTPVLNVIPVGGVPSDIAFVRTGGGASPLLRVAALVPTKSNAVLADPDTAITTPVALPAPYSNLSLVTTMVAGDMNMAPSAAATDVAMLWNGGPSSATGVAFWVLTVDQPYRSIQSVPVQQPIETVHDVGGSLYQDLKVLEMQNGSGFFVLDLKSRTASPLETMSRASILIAPDGNRLWAFAHGGVDLAKVDFSNLNPVPVRTEPPIESVYDVARPTAGRSLIAIHKLGTLGATIFDALNPDTATSRRVTALLLEGP
jgi:hypothetical protein